MKALAAAVFLWAAVAMGQTSNHAIKDLGDYAVAHHLKFEIFCMSIDERDPTMAYGGIAAKSQKGLAPIGYVEDGAEPNWVAHGRTQAEAAQKLLALLPFPPNFYPPHRPAPPKTKRQCHTVITTENYKRPCRDCEVQP